MTTRSQAQEHRVVIVGGGIMGCATAYYLQQKFNNAVSGKSQMQKSLKIVILEQESIACHSSGKAAGFLAKDWHGSGSAVESLAVLSFQLHEQLAKTFSAEAIGYRRMNCIGLGFGGIHQTGGREWLAKCDSESGRDMGKEDTLAQVHPEKLTKKLLEHTKDVEVMESCKVLGVSFNENINGGGDSRQASAVQVEFQGKTRTPTSPTLIPCDQVVFCLGAWSFRVRDWLLDAIPRESEGELATANSFADPTSQLPDKEARLQKNKSGRLDILKDTCGQRYTSVVYENIQTDNTAVFLDSKHDVELYPRPGNMLYACGCPDRVSVQELDGKYAKDIGPAEVDVKTIRGEVEKIVAGPGSSEKATTGKENVDNSSRFSAATSCVLPSSADGSIVLGKIEACQNAFIACGHTCWGILNGPGTGYILADLVLKDSGLLTNEGQLDDAPVVRKNERNNDLVNTGRAAPVDATTSDEKRKIDQILKNFSPNREPATGCAQQ
ncbi:unnamed protein product [Amoebophrya sp. A120]|nr:unnamed protein product [Amoebophrya sp. A120]|eukprot:GSA120T00021275001.1